MDAGLNREASEQKLDKRIVITVEEHSCFGGLGSVIAEIMAENNINVPFHRLCLPEVINCVGSQNELRRSYGIDAGGIEKYVSQVVCSDSIPESQYSK